jgi:DNA helicase HerA-like ATPase
VCIGTSPVANDAKLYVDPDRLFGRHLAVLGNTGSGKSCSVAGLIRWSIQAAQRESSARPNARFIILDPNGEYSRVFPKGDPTIAARIFKVNPENGESPLKVPLWFWNSAEWCAFTQASAKTQRPALIHALRYVREGLAEPASDPSHEMRRFLRTLVTIIRGEKNAGTPWGRFPQPKSFFEKLEKWKAGIEADINSFESKQKTSLEKLVDKIEALCKPRRQQNPHYDFTRQDIEELLQVTSDAHSAFGGSESDTFPSDVDAPRPFKGASLVRALEASAEMLNVLEHVEPLLIRIRGLIADARMKPIIDEQDEPTLEGWLNDFLGINKDQSGCVRVIDLSLVPSDVVHIVTAVIARMIFEALQRYVKHNHKPLPTVLVMEEAHTFIKRYKADNEDWDAAAVCCQVFERIAREGRKFGLGLVLSSQRPSELSPTVLSQCNTFLLHRITNDRDQELVHRLVPDNLRGLLRELPSLPSQHAILLGWASELPVLVKMHDLPESQRPRSDDPDFWDVWTGRNEKGETVTRKTDWKTLAEDWQQGSTERSEEDL